MIDLIYYFALVIAGLVIFRGLLLLLNEPIISISLFVLVDLSGRITYTGTYTDCKKHLTKDLKLIKLEGIL